jgi:hypothetical protein
MRATPRSVSVTGVAKVRFKDCLENARHRLLKQAVGDRGYAQRPRTSLARPFGYFDPPHRWSSVGAGLEPFADVLEPLFQRALKLLDAFPVNAACAMPVDHSPCLLEELRREQVRQRGETHLAIQFCSFGYLSQLC